MERTSTKAIHRRKVRYLVLSLWKRGMLLCNRWKRWQMSSMRRRWKKLYMCRALASMYSSRSPRNALRTLFSSCHTQQALV